MKLNKARKVILSIGVLIWHSLFLYALFTYGVTPLTVIIKAYFILGLVISLPTAMLYFVWGEGGKTNEGKNER